MPSKHPFLSAAILSLAVDPFQGVRSASLRAVETRRAVGWARVFGTNAFAEAVDEDSAIGSGAAIVVDDNLTSTARALARASTVLRRATLASDAGELIAAPQCGQEVGDVIEVTEPAVDIDARRYRVTSVRFDYVFAGARRATPAATMTLGLGEV